MPVFDVEYWQQRAITAEARLAKSEEDNFALAANSCPIDGGLVGDAGGTPYCTLKARLAEAETDARVSNTLYISAEEQVTSLSKRLAEAERNAARYAYLKRAEVLVIDWIISLPVTGWDAEVDRWIGKGQWCNADSTQGESESHVD